MLKVTQIIHAVLAMVPLACNVSILKVSVYWIQNPLVWHQERSIALGSTIPTES